MGLLAAASADHLHGSRSGHERTTSCSYETLGDEVTIFRRLAHPQASVAQLDRDGGPVRLLVHGQELRGHAVATRDEGRDVLVRVRVAPDADTLRSSRESRNPQ